jgi:hypothetical protein
LEVLAKGGYPYKGSFGKRFSGSTLTVNVVVGTNGDEVCEELVRLAWEAAQRIFRKYGVEVYVVPVVVSARTPFLSVNGVKVVIKSLPTVEELEDLILSIALYFNEAPEDEADILAFLEDPLIADAVLAN